VDAPASLCVSGAVLQVVLVLSAIVLAFSFSWLDEDLLAQYAVLHGIQPTSGRISGAL
jgi:hypothetical protein